MHLYSKYKYIILNKKLCVICGLLYESIWIYPSFILMLQKWHNVYKTLNKHNIILLQSKIFKKFVYW